MCFNFILQGEYYLALWPLYTYIYVRDGFFPSNFFKIFAKIAPQVAEGKRIVGGLEVG